MDKIEKVLWRLLLGLIVVVVSVNLFYFGPEDTLIEANELVTVFLVDSVYHVINALDTLFT